MKIALDLDGVLADLHGAMVEHTDFTDADFEQWDKPNYNHFMSEASRVWSEHWDDIPPVEPALEYKTAQLAADNHVDIVTNTAGPDPAIEQWLDKHDIVFESIVRPYSDGKDKHHLDYDLYIDDKPSMAGQVSILYIRDRTWNQTVRGDGEYLYHSYEPSYIESEGYPSGHFMSQLPWVIRVTSIADVLQDIDRR